jgi:hypothetical protein
MVLPADKTAPRQDTRGALFAPQLFERSRVIADESHFIDICQDLLVWNRKCFTVLRHIEWDFEYSFILPPRETCFLTPFESSMIGIHCIENSEL